MAAYGESRQKYFVAVSDNLGSLPPFAAPWSDARFSNCAFGSSAFSFVALGLDAHPGHAFLRSLVDA